MSEQLSEMSQLIDATMKLSARVRQLERQEFAFPGMSLFSAAPSIANNALTPIEWTQLYTNSVFYIDPLNPERIYARNDRGAKSFAVMGWADFAGDADGRRVVSAALYTGAGALIGSMPIGFSIQALADGAVKTIMPITGIAHSVVSGSYLEVSALHTAGSSLNCSFYLACFFLL